MTCWVKKGLHPVRTAGIFWPESRWPRRTLGCRPPFRSLPAFHPDPQEKTDAAGEGTAPTPSCLWRALAPALAASAALLAARPDAALAQDKPFVCLPLTPPTTGDFAGSMAKGIDDDRNVAGYIGGNLAGVGGDYVPIAGFHQAGRGTFLVRVRRSG